MLSDSQLRLLGVALVPVTLTIPAIFLCLPVMVLHELGGDLRRLGLLTAANGAGLALGSLAAVTTLSRMGTTALHLAHLSGAQAARRGRGNHHREPGRIHRLFVPASH